MADTLDLKVGLSGFDKAVAKLEREARARKINFDISFGSGGKNPIGRITKDIREVDSAFEASTKRVIAFGATVGLINNLQKAARSLAASTIEVQDAFARINVNLGETQDGLKRFGNEVFKAAKNTGQGFDVAATAAEELARQGLGAEESIKRLNDALVLSRISGLSSVQSVEALTAAVNTFSKEALDSTTIINKLVAVDTAFAVSSKDLAEGISRVGSSAQDAGVNFDQLVALITAAQQTTARGGAVIGNAFKTIFTRVQRGSTLDALEQLGVGVRNLEGDSLPAIQILNNLAKTYDTLGKSQQSQIAEQVGGVLQINVLKATLADLNNEYGAYNRAVTTSTNATDQAQKKNDELNKTYKSLINSVKVNTEQLFASIGNTKTSQSVFGGFLQIANDVLSKTNGEDQGSIFAEGIVNGISNVLSGPVFISLGTIFSRLFILALKDLGKFTTSILGVAKNLEIIKQNQIQIDGLLSKATALESEQLANATSLAAKKQIILDIEKRISGEQEKRALLSRALAGQFTEKTIFPPVLGVKKMKSTLGGGLPNYADPVADAIRREKAAGIPASQIYVDKDKRLISPSNPLGLLVANKIDEPLGGFQGVNRAIQRGEDPKKSGFKKGVVPNFATFNRAKDSLLADPKGTLLSPKEIDVINRSLIDYSAAILDGSKTLQQEAKNLAKLIPLNKESRIAVNLAFEDEEKVAKSILKADKEIEKQKKTQVNREKITQEKIAKAEEIAIKKSIIQESQSQRARIVDFKKSKGGVFGQPKISQKTIQKQIDLSYELANKDLINAKKKQVEEAFKSLEAEEAARKATIAALAAQEKATEKQRISDFKKAGGGVFGSPTPSQTTIQKQIDLSYKQRNSQIKKEISQAEKIKKKQIDSAFKTLDAEEAARKAAISALEKQEAIDNVKINRYESSTSGPRQTARELGVTPQESAAVNISIAKQQAKILNDAARKALSFEVRKQTTKDVWKSLKGGQLPEVKGDLEKATKEIERVARRKVFATEEFSGIESSLKAQLVKGKGPKSLQELFNFRLNTQLGDFKSLVDTATEQKKQKELEDILNRKFADFNKATAGPFGFRANVKEIFTPESKLKGRLDAQAASAGLQNDQAAQQRISERLAARRSKVSNLSLGAAFALPLAAGFVEPAFKKFGAKTEGGTAGGVASGALNFAAQGAGIGALFGPIGIGVGAAAGGLIGAFTKLRKSTEEVAESFNKTIAERGKIVESGQRLLQLNEQLQSAAKEGAPERVIKKINNEISKVLLDLPTNVRTQFSGAKTLDDLQSVIDLQSRNQSRDQARLDFVKLIRDSNFNELTKNQEKITTSFQGLDLSQIDLTSLTNGLNQLRPEKGGGRQNAEDFILSIKNLSNSLAIELEKTGLSIKDLGLTQRKAEPLVRALIEAVKTQTIQTKEQIRKSEEEVRSADRAKGISSFSGSKLDQDSVIQGFTQAIASLKDIKQNGLSGTGRQEFLTNESFEAAIKSAFELSGKDFSQINKNSELGRLLSSGEKQRGEFGIIDKIDQLLTGLGRAGIINEKGFADLGSARGALASLTSNEDRRVSTYAQVLLDALNEKIAASINTPRSGGQIITSSGVTTVGDFQPTPYTIPQPRSREQTIADLRASGKLSTGDSGEITLGGAAQPSIASQFSEASKKLVEQFKTTVSESGLELAQKIKEAFTGSSLDFEIKVKGLEELRELDLSEADRKTLENIITRTIENGKGLGQLKDRIAKLENKPNPPSIPKMNLPTSVPNASFGL